jgi:DnaJ family protein A protein 2
MPSQRHHEPGDLFIKLHVAFPETIDPSKVHFLEQALPPRQPVPKFERNVHLEEVSMSDLDARQQREQSRGGGGGGGDSDAMDEDEGEPRVQCAQQ